MNAFGADWEHGVPRVVASEPNRVNRLKALGNSIVPQIAYVIIQAMREAEIGKTIESTYTYESKPEGERRTPPSEEW